MSIAAVLLPVFVQVLLTFSLLMMTGRARFGVLKAGEVKIRDIALGERAWPAKVMQIANTYHNQFELPVLFYLLVPLAIITKKADLLFVVLAWLFVGLRLIHAYVYVTTNHLLTRFRVFLAGAVVLMAMWFIFAIRILVAGV
ncbi:MAG TPA: MAPEG family protein [Beijerinckiaceae bacterium]|jgi:hypothetical protein